MLGEEERDLVGELVHDGDEEVGASAGGVEHAEVEELPRRRCGVVADERRDLVEVPLERGHDAAADEMANERLRRVVDAAAFAAALVGQPEQLARRESQPRPPRPAT